MNARTHRSPENVWIGTGAVRQHDGKLPLYVCNTCGNDVVWVESKTTGRKYLANVSHGQNGHRFYIGANVHKCDEIMALRADHADARERDEEANNAARYLLHLLDEHENAAHELRVDQCLYCERGVANGTDRFRNDAIHNVMNVANRDA